MPQRLTGTFTATFVKKSPVNYQILNGKLTREKGSSLIVFGNLNPTNGSFTGQPGSGKMTNLVIKGNTISGYFTEAGALWATGGYRNATGDLNWVKIALFIGAGFLVYKYVFKK
jgi:hypothetical protein